MINSFVKVTNRNVNDSYNLDHDDLLSIIENPKIVNKKEDAELFYAFKMKSYPTIRDASETICFDTLILDFDGSDETMKDILKRFSNYRYYFYTSFNHMFDKETNTYNGVEKFRIILPLDKEYSTTWFKNGIMKAIFQNCRIFKDADQACAKITQYYVPCITEERKTYYRFRFNEGRNFTFAPFSSICNDIVKNNAKDKLRSNIKQNNEPRSVLGYNCYAGMTVKQFLDTEFMKKGNGGLLDAGSYGALQLCKKYNDDETLQRIKTKLKGLGWTEQDINHKMK